MLLSDKERRQADFLCLTVSAAYTNFGFIAEAELLAKKHGFYEESVVHEHAYASQALRKRATMRRFLKAPCRWLEV